jgi:hypothetical protein
MIGGVESGWIHLIGSPIALFGVSKIDLIPTAYIQTNVSIRYRVAIRTTESLPPCLADQRPLPSGRSSGAPVAHHNSVSNKILGCRTARGERKCQKVARETSGERVFRKRGKSLPFTDNSDCNHLITGELQ